MKKESSTAPVSNLSLNLFSPNFALAIILVFGFILRVWGLGFGLPDLFHADEPIVVNHALRYGTWDFHPHFFRIPPLVSYLLFGLYGLYFVGGKVGGQFQSVADFEQLFYADPTSFYLLGRFVFGALLGTVTIYALYRLAKKYFSERHALLSSLFFALCFLHIRDSHFIYTDILLVLVLTVSALTFFRLSENAEDLRVHVLSGVMIGLATATKYNGIVIVVSYLTLVCSQGLSKKCLGGVLLAGLGSFVTYFCLNPFSLLDFEFFMQEAAGESAAHAGVPWFLHLFRSLLGAVGLPVFVLGFLGMLKWHTFRDAKRLSLYLFLLAYYVILVRFGQPYERYVLPLLPFFLLFAADGLIALFDKFQWKSFLQATLVAVCVVIPVGKAIKWDILMSQPDVRTLAKQWVEENIPENSKIAFDVSHYMPRLHLSADELIKRKQQLEEGDARLRKLDYLLGEVASPKTYRLFQLTKDPQGQSQFLYEKSPAPYDIDMLREAGIEYVIASRVHAEGVHDPFHKMLEARATLLKAFTPYGDETILYPYQAVLTGGPFLLWDIFFRERNGQPLRVYKL